MKRNNFRLFMWFCVALAFAAPGASLAQGMQLQGMSASELQAHRDAFIRTFPRIAMNTAHDDGRFLRIMVKTMNAQRGVEIGSANGFGAIHMGMGFEFTGGHLTTIDIDPSMVRQCRANIKATGLEKTVACIEGDALAVIAKLDGPFDFVFIDAVKRDYFKYFKALEPKLTPQAVIIADNAIRAASAMQDFLSAMERHPDYDMVVIQASWRDKKDGMAVIHKKK